LKGESVLTGEGEGVLTRLMDDGFSNRLEKGLLTVELLTGDGVLTDDGFSNRLEKGLLTVELLTGDGESVLTRDGLSNRLEKGLLTVELLMGEGFLIERLTGEDVLIELERLMGGEIFII
jgi:hypothetical protein